MFQHSLMESALQLFGIITIAAILVSGIVSFFRRRHIRKHGVAVRGIITDIHQTGERLGAKPVMSVTLDVRLPDGIAASTTCESTFDAAAMPQPGDTLEVIVDQTDPNRSLLSGDGSLERGGRAPANQAGFLSSSANNETLAVGDIKAVYDGLGGKMCQVEIITFSTPRRTITCPPGEIVDSSVGKRVYVSIPAGASVGQIVKPWFSNPIPQTGNRIEALVTGMSILRDGAIATGTLLSVEPLSIDTLYQNAGVHKLTMRFRITPQDGGSPYEGSQSLAVVSPEKAAALSRIAATYPIRYDPADPQTFSVDTIALGFGDPRADLERLRELARSYKSSQ
jgi:hypothetical protein